MTAPLIVALAENMALTVLEHVVHTKVVRVTMCLMFQMMRRKCKYDLLSPNLIGFHSCHTMYDEGRVLWSYLSPELLSSVSSVLPEMAQ